MTIEKAKFIGNIAVKKGGAISAESFASISISGNSEFIKNEAVNETGDAIYAASSIYEIIFNKVRFYSTTASNFM